MTTIALIVAWTSVAMVYLMTITAKRVQRD